ncbi:hypothetical protein LOZ12_002903 [Ophidiomyces ophidiicola]|uniref:Uncharacterized protein n=1 Tax=Ophidiomyces ophidiicola TaxID=1387563 RepID=A0ACB8UZK3_9EURO|nr:hypothetical protein LOZ64_003109 [Ophidiomyces ophidiicola]KAI1953304.1 hypothetical protein LOZ62_001145 [Ophidiomyces ophidiicola]KAI2006419.1 hypothetical protein LOZ50_003144 [Ophidiomyces ophidiicola]KAI2033425.1 hypothetical protein LOZ45_000709 [Ophidiomyces ophidiicola]KAI2039339.1 hypothetical protein LOZ47_002391 [Ophidiomyces ophidiicola]
MASSYLGSTHPNSLAPWGYAVYRLTYNVGSEEKWDTALRIIQNAVYSSIEVRNRRANEMQDRHRKVRFEYQERGARHPRTPTVSVRDVKDKFHLEVFNDYAQYNGLSLNQVRSKFKKWITRVYWETGTHELPITPEFCIAVDDEALESLLVSGGYGFVKVIAIDPCVSSWESNCGWTHARPVDLWKFCGEGTTD